MSTNLWEDFAKRSRELYQQQADLAKSWMEGQAKLAVTLAGIGQGEGQAGAGGAEVAAAITKLGQVKDEDVQIATGHAPKGPPATATIPL